MTLSARGPVQHEASDASEFDDSWLGRLGWLSGGAFVLFVFLAAWVGWWGYRDWIDSDEDRGVAALVFCGFLVLGGALGLVLSWASYWVGRDGPVGPESAFAATLAMVLAVGGAGSFLFTPVPEPPVESITQLLEKANANYIENHYGLDAGHDTGPIVFVEASLNSYILEFNELADTVEGEDEQLLRGLVACLEKMRRHHLHYTVETRNFEWVKTDILGGTYDLARMMSQRRAGDDVIDRIDALDRCLIDLPIRLPESFIEAGVEETRAQALASAYIDRLNLPLQREILAAESRSIVIAVRNAVYLTEHADFIESNPSQEALDTFRQTTDTQFDERWDSENLVWKLKLDLNRELWPGSEVAADISASMEWLRSVPVVRPISPEAERYLYRVYDDLAALDKTQVLFLEDTRSREQIAVRRRPLLACIDAAKRHLAYCESMPGKIESVLREDGFSEELIQEYKNAASDLHGLDPTRSLSRWIVSEFAVEVELLDLFEAEFGRWHIDPQGYTVFNSPRARWRGISL